jgi:hypothetical protein
VRFRVTPVKNIDLVRAVDKFCGDCDLYDSDWPKRRGRYELDHERHQLIPVIPGVMVACSGLGSWGKVGFYLREDGGRKSRDVKLRDEICGRAKCDLPGIDLPNKTTYS